MSFMTKVKAVPRNLPHGTARLGLKGTLVDKGERYGAAYVYGYLKGFYREKFVWKDYGLDLWSGAALLAAGVVLNVATNGRSRAADHLERVGDAGIQSYLNSIGASLGAKKAGRVVQVLQGGRPLGALGGKSGVFGDVVGMIPQAMGGAYLSPEEMQNYSARR